MVKNMVRDLAHNEFAEKAGEVDQLGIFPWDNIKLMAEHGLLGINIPEKYSGAGSDTVSHVLAIEEVARVCASTSVVLTTQALVLAPLMIAGTEEQKQKYVTPMARGDVLGSFCLTEPGAGSDAGSIKTLAVRDGDNYVINGQKCFITNAGESEIYVVVAKTDKDKGHRGISLFVVEKGTPGLTFGKKEDKMGIRGSVTREVIFENCCVPKENLLGEENMGFRILMQTLDHTRTGVGAQALGIAQGALDAAVKYAGERVQFGNTLNSFQTIQVMLADMATQVEAARLLVHQAAYDLDEGKDITRISSMAKLCASDVAMQVTTDAVQVLGGYGYIKEYPVERMMRDAKITQIYEGTNQVQRLVIAKTLF
ncbi:acyl-CoA dehydrogenase [Metallumcola ferriviriculae]|uniref:Acyl-CoA dehydrogenase n=2 Tax=Metallumcola ferriviriculae TaxID=3039180 RepID=A0AAU0UPV8_9FIRM|nr:acyl-CoA dehydrogenase [Desulfitibacteraceae bacterium MK1]